MTLGLKVEIASLLMLVFSAATGNHFLTSAMCMISAAISILGFYICIRSWQAKQIQIGRLFDGFIIVVITFLFIASATAIP